jgi:hypothetical protein
MTTTIFRQVHFQQWDKTDATPTATQVRMDRVVTLHVSPDSDIQLDDRCVSDTTEAAKFQSLRTECLIKNYTQLRTH